MGSKKLSRNDWKLIREALEMLCIDYEKEHPEQDRLNQLLAVSDYRGYGKQKVKYEPKSKFCDRGVFMNCDGPTLADQVLKLRILLEEAQREKDLFKVQRDNVSSRERYHLESIHSQAAQLSEAVHDLAEAREITIETAKERNALAAQLTGMREALKNVLQYENIWGLDQEYKDQVRDAIAIPASEWEKRVQGLVEVLRGIAMTYDRCNHPTKAGRALAAWEGK